MRPRSQFRVNRAPLRDILRAFHTHPQEKMVKQVNITAYAVPKQSLLETPKRKRTAELVTAGQIEVISPSQASPEHKAGRKASQGDEKGTEASTPRTDTPLQEQSRDDIKRKARGRPPTVPNRPGLTSLQTSKVSQQRLPFPQALQLQLIQAKEK